MADTSDFRNGLILELEGQLYRIVEFQHVKPGKGGAFVRTKLKHVKTGRVIERTFRAGEKVNPVRLEESKVQYLYCAGDDYVLMNTDTYDQITLPAVLVGDVVDLLKENESVSLLARDGEPLTVELPVFVELQISKTDPGVRGDTASGGSKPATLETGAVVQVPLFLEEGDVVKVDTRTRKYVERVGK